MTTAIERQTIERARRAFAEALPASSTVILFGPRARGAESGTDYNFLVIEDEVEDAFGEMTRLGRILGRLLIPADVVVVSKGQVDEQRSIRGTVIYEALTEGRVVVEP